MWRYALLWVLLLGSASLAQTAPVPKNIISCEKEEDCLSQLGSLATRKGDALILRLESGKTKVLRDTPKACKEGSYSRCIVHHLRSFRADDKLFVVEFFLTEGSGAYVIDARSGRMIYAPSLPVFSPNGQRFVATNTDSYSEREYEFAIWSLKSGRARKEFRYSTPGHTDEEDWEVIDWDGNERVKLKVSPAYENASIRETETFAVHTPEGWKLSWPLPDRQ